MLIELIAGSARGGHYDSHVPRATYDLDSMMEALVQGKGGWVHEQTLPLAEAGFLKAQLMMGILYQLGIGVRQDGEAAVKWYRSAAEQDDALAWKNLGTLYLLGLAGVAVDKAEAHHCFSRAKALEIEQMAHEWLGDPTIH
jgi:TPR repeat protein